MSQAVQEAEAMTLLRALQPWLREGELLSVPLHLLCVLAAAAMSLRGPNPVSLVPILFSLGLFLVLRHLRRAARAVDAIEAGDPRRLPVALAHLDSFWGLLRAAIVLTVAPLGLIVLVVVSRALALALR